MYLEVEIKNKNLSDYNFAYSKNKEESNLNWQSSNILNITSSGTYYIFVKNLQEDSIVETIRVYAECIDGKDVCSIQTKRFKKIVSCTINTLPFKTIHKVIIPDAPVVNPPTLDGGSKTVDAPKRVVWKNSQNEIVMDIETYSLDGRAYIKDHAAEKDFNEVNNLSNTTIKYAIVNKYEKFFTVQQLKEGIDVSAFKGRPLYICKLHVDNAFAYDVKDQIQLCVYIPTDNSKMLTTVPNADGTPIEVNPPEYVFNMNTYMPQYLETLEPYTTNTAIKNDQFLTWREKNVFNESNLARLGKLQTNGDITDGYLFMGEQWLTNLGHPRAYTYSQAQFDTWFTSFINDNVLPNTDLQEGAYQKLRTEFYKYVNGNTRLIMYNNESQSGGSLGGKWQYVTVQGNQYNIEDFVKSIYREFKQNNPQVTFIPWNIRSFKYNATWGSLDAYNRLNFAGTKAEYEQEFEYESHGSYIDDLGVFQAGDYFYSYSFGYTHVGTMIWELSMANKYRPNDECLINFWSTMETVGGNERGYHFSRTTKAMNGAEGLLPANSLIRADFKSAVNGGDAFAVGAAMIFFHRNAGYIGWSEPYYKTENVNDLNTDPYDADNSRYLTFYTDTETGAKPPMRVLKSHVNLDEREKGEIAVGKYPEYFNIEPRYANVMDKGNYLGEVNSSIGGLIQNGTPIVAYKINQAGNKALLYAYDPTNTQVKNITYKINNIERVVTVYGNYPSTLEIEL